MFTHRKRAVVFLIYFTTSLATCMALHIRAYASPLPRANNAKCNEVLTKNLECPSIGAYPVAGACDYFVRCIQTELGVESEVDFCPDGQVYVVNRCIKSEKNECPQKGCAQLPKGVQTTTDLKPLPPTHVNMPIAPPTTRSPLLNLHPSLNGTVRNISRMTVYTFLFLLLFAINNNI